MDSLKSMLEVFKIFDAYSLRARLFPALIAGLPTLALLIVLVPWNHVGLPHAIAVAVAMILLFAFADVARRLGRTVEARLGTRATPELLHHDNAVFDAASKQRYKAFLARGLNLPAPTDADELADRAKANQFYLSAGNWLREHTRDTKRFHVLFGELTTYGFRRNLLGLKPMSLFLNGLVLLISAAILLYGIEFFAEIAGLRPKLGMVIAAAVLHSAYMAFAVNEASVREASTAYGRQLILSCETLMATQITARAARPRAPRGKPKADV